MADEIHNRCFVKFFNKSKKNSIVSDIPYDSFGAAVRAGCSGLRSGAGWKSFKIVASVND